MATATSSPDASTALPDVVDACPANGISVLIVGSGIGGLSAARECHRIGCSVRVLEKRPEPVLTGDAVSLGPAMLHTLRPYPSLQRAIQAVELHTVETVCRLDGTVLPGVRLTADLVVAADGVGSRSWTVVGGQKVCTRSSGDAIFRASYAAVRVAGDALVEEAYPLPAEEGKGTAVLYFGEDISIAVTRFPDQVIWNLKHKARHGHRPAGGRSWHAYTPVSEALTLLEPHPEIPASVCRIMQATPEDALIDWPILWRDPRPTWTSKGGRVLQLGDAAHTFHPSSGSGANMAVEDAVTLAACLRLAGREGVPWATRVSNLLRFGRVACLQAYGLWSRHLRAQGGKAPGHGRWIAGHDAEAYALAQYAAARNQLQNGTPFRNTNTPPGLTYVPWTIEDLIPAKERGDPTPLDGDWS